MQLLDTKCSNKEMAWDSINVLFLQIGHQHLKDKDVLNSLTKSVQAGQQSCVIGASSIFLIKALLSMQQKLVVIDFSEKMCSNLQNELSSKALDIIACDFLQFSKSNAISFHHMYADQVLNCMDENQVFQFFVESGKLLKEGGELVCVIKVGLYEFEEKLLAYEHEHNIQNSVLDTTHNIIDYRKTELYINSVLEEEDVAKKQLLIHWYLLRGKEKRFSIDDLNNFEALYNLKECGLRLASMHNYDNYKDLFCLRFLKNNS